MLIIGILLNIVGLGIFCWALFALATHALPFFVGMTVGIYSFQAGAGPFGAIVVGFVAAGFTLVVGQYAFSVARSPIVRLVIGLLFAVPAARAGYDVTLALAHLGIPSEWWRESFAMLRRHRCRGHRLGARVDATDPALQTGRCTQPYSAAEWGDDRGRVTVRVYRLSVGHRRGYRARLLIATSRSSLALRLSRVISSADSIQRWLARALASVCSDDKGPPFCTPGFLFLRRECGASCVGRSLAGTSPKCCSAHAST